MITTHSEPAYELRHTVVAGGAWSLIFQANEPGETLELDEDEYDEEGEYEEDDEFGDDEFDDEDEDWEDEFGEEDEPEDE